jgi:hypothetical protein
MLSGFHLSLFMGPIATRPVPREVIDALQSVSITKSAGERSGFSLTFSVSKQGLIQQQLLPMGFFDPMIRVQIIITIGGSPTFLMDGIIAKQDLAVSNDPAKSTLTVVGEDLTLAMDLIDFSGIPYPMMPNEARVAIMLAKYAMFGMVPEIIPSVFVSIPNPFDTIPSQQGTDLAYIRYLASEVGYVFYVEPFLLGESRLNRAYWGPEIRWGSVQAPLNVNMDAHTNVDSLSFSFDGMSGTIYTMMVQPPELCGSLKIPLPPVGILRPPLALKQAIPHKLEPIETVNKEGPIRGALIGLARATQRSDAVTGQGTLDVLRYGNILKPRGLVDVRGAGLTYDGTYYVKSVTHNIKRGEYKQNFSLAREGVLPIQMLTNMVNA